MQLRNNIREFEEAAKAAEVGNGVSYPDNVVDVDMDAGGGGDPGGPDT